jgi:hypothetical protein
MNEALRPMNLGEILDRTAHLYRSRFLLFLGISIIPTAVMVALACVAGLIAAWWNAADAGSVPSQEGFVLVGLFGIGVVLVALPAYLAVTALATAAMSHAVSRVHLGESTSIRDAYKSVWRRGWRAIGLYLLQVLFIWVVPFVVWIVLALLSATGAALAQKAGMGNVADSTAFGLVMLLMLLALAVYVIWMLIELSLAFPASVVEEMRVWPSIKRSFALCKGTRGRIFLLGLLAAALSWLLWIGTILILTILFYLIPGINGQKHAQIAGIVILFIVYGSPFVIQALIRPIYGIALVLFYYDQRIRHEGYDIERMMDAAGLTAPPPAALDESFAAVAGEEPWPPVATRFGAPSSLPEDPRKSLGNEHE